MLREHLTEVSNLCRYDSEEEHHTAYIADLSQRRCQRSRAQHQRAKLQQYRSETFVLASLTSLVMRLEVGLAA